MSLTFRDTVVLTVMGY